jgi:hypothetical protein
MYDVEEKMFVKNFTFFDIEKSLASVIYKECVVKAFGVIIMSSCSIPFPKNVFTVLPKLVEKTKETYVLPLLIRCYCVTANFDL